MGQQVPGEPNGAIGQRHTGELACLYASSRTALAGGQCGRNEFFASISTTTVIMKTLESEDEGVCGAHDVDNGFDEPRTASCVGRSTRVTAVQANAQVRATQSPISGALPAPSVQQAHRFPCFFFLLAELDA